MMMSFKKAFGVRPLLAAIMLVALLGAAPLVSAWAAKGDLMSLGAEDQLRAPLRITLGKAEMVEVPGAVSDIMVADSSIVSVQAVQANRLYVVGLAVGDTNIIALDDKGDVIDTIDVHVTYDLKAINAFLKGRFPDDNVLVDVLHDQIILSGKVSTPEVASKVTDIVSNYTSDLQDIDGSPDELISSLLEVKGEQQVMLQVKIVEASRSFVRDLGIETLNNDLDETAATSIFGSTRPTSSRGGNASITTAMGGGISLPNDPAATFRVLTDSGILGIGSLGLFIDALEREDLVTVLAEPNLTAVSGQQAGFLAGGEFPIPVGRDQVGNLVIDYREFGVSLNFRPVVLSGDRISLQLNTEVSSLDFVNSVSAGDLTVPGLDVRRAETTIEIPSGGSLMIAGLLQSDAVEGMAGLPGIRKTPILGDLISSNSFERNETELVVMISAYLVEPFADKEKVQKMPKQQNNHLASAFAANIRKQYGAVDDEIFNLDKAFGYILD
ncbi:MAG: phospholipid-binding domain-containing protein [Micavibrio sp.]|nr:phospholipid-binding domain-containing protein [Micavibrio sp.]